MTSTHLLSARRGGLLALGLSLLLLPAPSLLAAGQGSYSLEILVDGRPLTKYAARGTTYVEALRGREYSVRLRNHTPQRVAIALSVDGLNSIDAKSTPAALASKWVLEPYGSITLDGWQTNSSTARRFFFTTEDRSYGAWLGRTRNLGLISAAVYRERSFQPAPILMEERESGERGRSDKDSGAGAPGAAGAPPAAESRLKSQADPQASDDYAATGIGRQVDHEVRSVQFITERSPAAVLEIRYEYREALARLGVLPQPCVRYDDPLDRRESSHGFDGMEFAPDPFDADCR